jgi:2-succinyl-6-hydroxy-2,4-cyclohexadiene-1-carboxylate synthase
MQSTDQNEPLAQHLSSRSIGNPLDPHLVLIHGFTQNGWSWREIVKELADSYYVTTVDLPGHGGSVDLKATDLPDTARLVGEAGGKGIYIGYSLGGRVALTLACSQPDLMQALVLVSASPGIADDKERLQRQRFDGTLAERLCPSDGSPAPLTLDAFLDEWLAHPLFAHLGEIAQDRETRLQNHPEGLAHSLRSAGTGVMAPLHHRLASLAMPILCIAGERDERYVDIARWMVEQIGSNALLAVAHGVGHSVPFESPATFLAFVQQFLAQLGD